jgi:hypothetical protein
MADNPSSGPGSDAKPGPKQQPNDPGDTTARRGSAAPDGYWVHDDFGPRIYVPVNAGDGAGLDVAFARLLADNPQITDGQVTLREVDDVVWLEGWVDDEAQSQALEAAVRLLAGGRRVQNVLTIT